MEIKEMMWKLIDDWYSGSWLYTHGLIVLLISLTIFMNLSPSMISFYA
jgi:hypothetical protein